MESRPRSFSQARISFEKDVPGWGKIQPKGGGPSFSFGCERKEEKESDSASGTLGTPNKGRSMERGRGKRRSPMGLICPGKTTLRGDLLQGVFRFMVSCQLRCPKVSKGRAESPLVRPLAHIPAPEGIDAPALAREVGLPPYGILASFGAPADAYPLSRVGIDAPTTARVVGLQPYGAFTLFFRWRKKSVQKKASGTATPGKSPLLPIFERGSSQCRAQTS